MSVHVIVLAAGQGSRMKSDLPKVLHPLSGKPLLQHVLDTVDDMNVDGVHVVVGHQSEKVKDTISDLNINWCFQAEQLGTGHAVAQAINAIPKESKVLILYGDVPLTKKETLTNLLETVTSTKLALLTVFLENPRGYGRIIRDEDSSILAIVEEKDANELERQVNEVNTGILAISAESLHRLIPSLGNKNAQGEYYLTDIIEMFANEGNSIIGQQPEHEQEVQGVNNKLQLCELECWNQSRFSEQLILDGVTLFDPNRLDVRGSLKCGRDVVIDLNCIFEGDVELGDGVNVGPNCVIRNSKIQANSVIQAYTMIEDSIVGENAIVGPYARLRPGTELCSNAKVGNFVETKKTYVGKGSKINHLSYVGDSVLGENVNIGAGTITCNYDGVNKFKTEIGDGVFVGSNSSLVAPVNIGAQATIGAGSTITKDVAQEELAVARSRQKNIVGWNKPEKNN